MEQKKPLSKIKAKKTIINSYILKKIDGLKQFISTFTAEILVVTGAFFIVDATFKINPIAGLYCLGFIVVILGMFLAITKK